MSPISVLATHSIAPMSIEVPWPVLPALISPATVAMKANNPVVYSAWYPPALTGRSSGLFPGRMVYIVPPSPERTRLLALKSR